MTFDELWRLDLARKRVLTDSVDKAEEVDLFEEPPSSFSELDDVDEAKVNRFVEWLEESLPAVDSNEDSIG
jgi:hypothetical protein